MDFYKHRQIFTDAFKQDLYKAIKEERHQATLWNDTDQLSIKVERMNECCFLLEMLENIEVMSTGLGSRAGGPPVHYGDTSIDGRIASFNYLDKPRHKRSKT